MGHWGRAIVSEDKEWPDSNFAINNRTFAGGNKYTLLNKSCHNGVRKFSLTARTVNMWKDVSDHVVDVDSIQKCKFRLDKFWLHQPIAFDWRADITGTGNRPFKCDCRIDWSYLKLTLKGTEWSLSASASVLQHRVVLRCDRTQRCVCVPSSLGWYTGVEWHLSHITLIAPVWRMWKVCMMRERERERECLGASNKTSDARKRSYNREDVRTIFETISLKLCRGTVKVLSVHGSAIIADTAMSVRASSKNTLNTGVLCCRL